MPSTSTSRTASSGSSRCARALATLPDVDDPARAIVEIVYADVDPVLWGAAELSVRAQLAYLTS